MARNLAAGNECPPHALAACRKMDRAGRWQLRYLRIDDAGLASLVSATAQPRESGMARRDAAVERRPPCARRLARRWSPDYSNAEFDATPRSTSRRRLA